MLLKFTKMHGLGNDFMVIDGVTQKVQLDTQTIQRWADRNFGVGFDQLLLVEAPKQSDVDFRYRIFNSDGSEVEQCGNGARCFALFVRTQKLTAKKRIRVETLSGIIELTVTDNNQVTVDMGEPTFTPNRIPLRVETERDQYDLVTEDDGLVRLGAVSMGNPHGVVRVEDIDQAPVLSLGPILENHPDFPNRANIGFMEVVSPCNIKLRVYERGVGETLACGTGACAAMVVAHRNGWVDDEVNVELPGGTLIVQWRGNGSVLMTGPANRVFEGRMRT